MNHKASSIFRDQVLHIDLLELEYFTFEMWGVPKITLYYMLSLNSKLFALFGFV